MPRQSDQCAQCGRAFAPGDVVAARLFQSGPAGERPAGANADPQPKGADEQKGADADLPPKPDRDPRSAQKPAAEIDFVRRDYCPGCEPEAGQVPVATWRARRPAPADKGRRAIDPAAAFELFERLAPATFEEEVQLRFLLALLLWRKRVLKLAEKGDRQRPAGERSDPQGGETWEFYHARTEQTFRVTRPALDDSQLERLGDRLEEVLAGSIVSDSLGAGVESEPAGA